MKILQFHARITNNHENHTVPLENHENNEKFMIFIMELLKWLKIFEFHKGITKKNKNHRIPCEDHEKHANVKTS